MARQLKQHEIFFCKQCGEWHEELLSDFSLRLPDEVTRLSYLERYQRARFNADFCTLDDNRYFIHCMLKIPFNYTESDSFFGWGLWVEVNRDQHDLHMEHWSRGADDTEPFRATIANNLEGYPDLVGEEVYVKLYDAHRPLLHFPAISHHPLAVEERNGLSFERHHELAFRFNGNRTN